MEMLELNNANQTTVNSNGTYNISQHQQMANNQQSQQQLSNMNPAHLYCNQQQQQRQQQGLRYVNNPKISKHRELPVDVPDSFVGIAKQSPRYPPPKPHRHTPSPMPYNHNTSLRSSVKLKQLEKSKNGQHPDYPAGQSMQPAINQAFELNEHDASPASQISTNHQAAAAKAKQAPRLEQQSSQNVCSVYRRLERNLNGEFAGVSNEARLAKLLSIYNIVHMLSNAQPDEQQRPITGCKSVSDLLHSVIYLLNRDGEMTDDAAELFTILRKHEIVDGVCSAYDRIAQTYEFAKSSRPTSPQLPKVGMASENDHIPQCQMENHAPSVNGCMHQMVQGYVRPTPDQQVHWMEKSDSPDRNYQNGALQPNLTEMDLITEGGAACTKTVRIEKTSNQALGATIKNDVDGSVIVGRVVCGGAAQRSGLLHEGDEIVEVNGIQMRGRNVNEVVDLLEAMEGTLTFTIIERNYFNKPARPVYNNSQDRLFVRAFFNYDGENDDFIPCKELGLSFEKGQILAIIDQTDPQWWQAHRDADSEWRLAGLIPSISFLRQREAKGDTSHEADIAQSAMFKHERKTTLVSMLFNCPKGSSPSHRIKKRPPNKPFGPEEIPYYEEVYLYYPNKYRKRPIILVGPKMIGQREIQEKLLQDSNRFASATSTTSRPMEPHEKNGVNFHFVTRAQFEADIKAGKFIEHGQYQNKYYGTSLDAMKEVVNSRKTCVHLVNAPSIFNFRQGRGGIELKPFFVFVRPDDSHPEKLRNLVSKFSLPRSNIEENIKAILAEMQSIEDHYLPFFDLVLNVTTDIERAYRELLFEIEKIESEPQWIPRFWQETMAGYDHA